MHTNLYANAQKRTPAYNSTYPKGGVLCFADTFLQAESLVLRIEFSGKNPADRVAAKRLIVQLWRFFS